MIVVSDTLIFGMLVGATLFSAGLFVGFLMGAARSGKPEPRIVATYNDLPESARPRGKPEMVGSR